MNYIKCGGCLEQTEIFQNDKLECVECGEPPAHRHDNGELLCSDCYHEYDNDVYEVQEPEDDTYYGDRES